MHSSSFEPIRLVGESTDDTPGMAGSYSFEWPSEALVAEVKIAAAKMANKSKEDVNVVASPYRICPLGAHIDHQGGPVLAMAIDKGILLGFIPSGGDEVFVRSKQFSDDVRFRIGDDLQEHANSTKHWGSYVIGAVFALKKFGCKLSQGIIAFIDGGLKGFHGAGISSSAAIGVSLLLALEFANGLHLTPLDNIELDRLIENDFLGLKNGILDQSAILLSRKSHLTVICCKDRTYQLVPQQTSIDEKWCDLKILLAFSGLQQPLTTSGYNLRVKECQEAARILLRAAQKDAKEPVLLSDVIPDEYGRFKERLEGAPARRARHFFTECERVMAGIKAWESCELQELGRLITDSGKSSITNYECGCKPMIELLDIVLKAPGVFGARFSGGGFRGCCVALVSGKSAIHAAVYIQEAYKQIAPQVAGNFNDDFPAVLVCETADHACVWHLAAAKCFDS